MGTNGVSQSQIDQAVAAETTLAQQVIVARSALRAAQAQAGLSRAGITTAASAVEQARAALQQAELNLSYTRVTAPVSGRIARRAVEVGGFVQAGQLTLAIVPRQVWVVANFKETQLDHMRAGQPVSVRIDALPRRTFEGRVDSFQDGTGSRFSLFPPENAAGNFIKVVQRVPVKIVLDGPGVASTGAPLSPGMSADVEVKVR